MTTTHRDLDELVRYPGIATSVRGRPAEVAEMLLRADIAGRLIHMTLPTRPDVYGQVRVDVRLRALPIATRPVGVQGPRAAAPRPRIWMWASAAAGLLAVLAAAVLVVQWVLAHLPVVIAVLVIAGLVLAKAGRSCPGVTMHCRKH